MKIEEALRLAEKHKFVLWVSGDGEPILKFRSFKHYCLYFQASLKKFDTFYVFEEDWLDKYSNDENMMKLYREFRKDFHWDYCNTRVRIYDPKKNLKSSFTSFRVYSKFLRTIKRTTFVPAPNKVTFHKGVQRPTLCNYNGESIYVTTHDIETYFNEPVLYCWQSTRGNPVYFYPQYYLDRLERNRKSFSLTMINTTTSPTLIESVGMDRRELRPDAYHVS